MMALEKDPILYAASIVSVPFFMNTSLICIGKVEMHSPGLEDCGLY
jgi:predicted permease